MTRTVNACENCEGQGWVYELDERRPLGDGMLPLGPGVLCPVCMGGMTFKDPRQELEKLAQRREPE
jgi:hypothetical protein